MDFLHETDVNTRDGNVCLLREMHLNYSFLNNLTDYNYNLQCHVVRVINGLERIEKQESQKQLRFF